MESCPRSSLINRSFYDDSDTVSTVSRSTFKDRSDQLCENSQVPSVSSKIDQIAMNSASDVHIGNRIIYNAPVTIAQDQNTVKESKERPKKKKKKPKRLYLILGIILLLTAILVASVLSTVFYLSLSNNPSDNNSNNNNNNNSTIPDEEEEPLKIVKRSEWGAKDPVMVENFPNFPLNQLLIIHTVTANCYTLSACGSILRIIQNFHIEQNYNDIGYNFLIGGDGVIYEGKLIHCYWQ